MLISCNKKITKSAFCLTVLLSGLMVSSFLAASSEETQTSTTSSDSTHVPSGNAQTDTTNKSENNKDTSTTIPESTDTKSSSTETSDAQNKPIFMWKATRGDQTVYVLGTIHYVRAGFFPVSDEIEKAFSQSKELFVECIPDREKVLAVSKSLREKYAYKKGDNLYKHLSPQTSRVFNEYLAWAGEPMEIYETCRPFEVSGLIESDAVRRYGLTVPGLDRYLIKKSKQQNKKIGQLESVEFQLNMLSGFSEEEQNAELLSSLLTLQDVSLNLDHLIYAWRQGNSEELERIVTKASRSDSELKAVYDKIIVTRNLGMVSKLEECLKQDGSGTYLVAVGAGHLVGSYGIPALLKEKGFSVSQVSEPKEPPKTSFGSSKLERLYYPEGKFSILLPGPPVVQYGNLLGLRIVNYIYPTFAGAYTIGYLIMPETISDPSKLNAFYNSIGIGMVGSQTAKFSKTRH